MDSQHGLSEGLSCCRKFSDSTQVLRPQSNPSSVDELGSHDCRETWFDDRHQGRLHN